MSRSKDGRKVYEQNKTTNLESYEDGALDAMRLRVSIPNKKKTHKYQDAP